MTLIELWVVLHVTLHLICIAKKWPIERISDNLESDQNPERIYDIKKTAHITEKVQNFIGLQTVYSSLRASHQVNVRVWCSLA